jgi:hypothetical protein
VEWLCGGLCGGSCDGFQVYICRVPPTFLKGPSSSNSLSKAVEVSVPGRAPERAPERALDYREGALNYRAIGL